MIPVIEIYSEETHYEMAKSWWEGHGFPPVNALLLPKLGVIISSDGVGKAGAWLYMDNSVGVSMLEWIVTNPENTPRESLKAIKVAVKFLREQAKAFGYVVMLATCRQASLLKVLEKNGFQKTDENVYHAVSVLE